MCIRDSSIPIVTDEGIEYYNNQTHYIFTHQSHQVVHSKLEQAWNYAEQDKNGDTYYLYSDALYLRRKNTNQVKKILDRFILTEGDEERRYFKHFSLDKTGNVWITTELGVVVLYDKKTGGRVIPIKDNRIGICSNTPEASYRVAHGPKETLVSHACGILIYDQEEDALIDINDYYNIPIWSAERWTYTIEHLTDQIYVVGSFRQGLHILDLEQKTTYSISPELDNIIISTITTTDDNIAWCMTDAGIICYNHEQGTYKMITSKNGMPNDYWIFQKAIPFDSSHLVLGGPGNIIYVNTDRVKADQSRVLPIVTNIQANDEVVFSNYYLSDEQKVSLDYHQNDLEVQLSHLTSFSGSPTTYYYQMKGLSDTWIDTRATDHVRFFDLDPGDYVLSITTSLPVQGAESYSIPISISPPIWATQWFRLLAALSLGLLLYYLYTSRIRHIKNQTLLNQEEKENDKLKSQNELIQKQNIELQQLNESKDKFFSILAHDIRAPLAAFSGLGKQLNYHIERKNYKKIELLSDHIQDSSEKLTGLVDNLLNWSLVQTGRFSYDPESISVGEVTATVASELLDVVSQKNVTIKRNILPHSIVSADSQSLHIILRNILSNAIKFSHEGGEIGITSSHENGHVDIMIVDQGVGISAEQITHVMNNQIKSSPGTAGELGVGLGLQMCRELVKMNKGTLKISPTVPSGTTVTITLPKESIVHV